MTEADESVSALIARLVALHGGGGLALTAADWAAILQRPRSEPVLILNGPRADQLDRVVNDATFLMNGRVPRHVRRGRRAGHGDVRNGRQDAFARMEADWAAWSRLA